MTAEDKEAFKKRMAEGRAKAAKSKSKEKPKTKPKAKPKTKPKAKTKAKAATKTKTVRKKATVKKAKKVARKATATQKATRAKTTVRVRSRKEQKGKSFIKEVDALADRIHEKSATGEFVQVPVYKVSRSDAKKKAFKALTTARKTKNVTNVRLKL